MDQLNKRIAIITAVFFAVSMSAIVYLSTTRTVVISDVVQDEVITQALKSDGELNGTNDDSLNANISDGVENAGTKALDDNALSFSNDMENTEYLCIPLPVKTDPESIVIENHYMDSELYVVLKDAAADFYRENSISGNREPIESGCIEASDRGVRLKFNVKGLYEYKSIMENDVLYISYYTPRELYNRIVVIDAACGGQDTGISQFGYNEKDITLNIVRELKERLDESGIKTYYTRMDDVNPSDEVRISLANAAKADAYIRVEVSEDEDTSRYGITAVYNGDYFIPGFGNVELADILEKEITTAVKGRAIGLVESDTEDYTLLHSTVPSAIVKVGYLSNEEEASLLGRTDYVSKIADGIFNGIMSMYEE